MPQLTPTGLPMGDLPWGSHVCNFYDDAPDLADTLVPFFKAGIDHGDAAVWVTSAPLEAEDARRALAAAVPDLGERERSGQIEIIDHRQWYLHNEQTDAAATLAGWLEREERALARGYQGLRLTGNTAWVETAAWSSFVEYERTVNAGFRPRRILALCSYCAGRCSAGEVLDVVENHQFAIARRRGEWSVLETGAQRIAREVEARRQLEVLTAELRAALDDRDNFLAMASHELRTPLTSVQIQIDAISRLLENNGEIASRTGQKLTAASRGVERLCTIVDRLLDVTKIRTGTIAPSCAETDLIAVLDEVVRRAQPDASRAGSTIHLQAPPSVAGWWDPSGLDHVFTNLVSNAVKFGRGGAIDVVVTADDATATVRVRDHGVGMAAADKERVFERFERAAPGTHFSGLGLGLWIVKQVVIAHGGSVAVDSAPDAGATFVVELPRRRP